MVSSSDEYHNFLSSKRLKLSYFQHLEPRDRDRDRDDTSSSQPITAEERFSHSHGHGFADSELEMSCQSNGNCSDLDLQESSGAGAAVPMATGWMYINECGQMCGPYIQQQLYEGLSSGFLPEDLPVYPLLNGALLNSVPLKYFKLFPDHVSTGFAYLPLGLATLPQAALHLNPVLLTYYPNQITCLLHVFNIFLSPSFSS